MNVSSYYLYRVSYFILDSRVGHSTVVAKTPEEAEDIVKNYLKPNEHNPIQFYETTKLHAVTHISPELLLEVFSPPSH